MELYRQNNRVYTVTPEGGECFVDHSAQRRGGHLGHAMVEYEPNKLLCFYANCTGEVLEGHTGIGWMEMKRSEDGGKTFGEPEIFPYSRALYEMDFGITAMCEKAVRTPDGAILVFTLICDMSECEGRAWGQHPYPTYLKSFDGGRTWGTARRLDSVCGRVYDLSLKDGVLYVLMEVGHNGEAADVEFRLYRSEDSGESWSLLSVLPFSAAEKPHYYGAFEWLDDTRLIAYTYCDDEDEVNEEYTISEDGGKTWSPVATTPFARGLRNMQLAKLEDAYFMFGRNNRRDGDIVVYCSPDAVHWDSGTILKKRTAGIGAYSNAIVVNGGKTPRLLFQSSHAYDGNRTNIYHWWIDVTE